MIVFIVCVAITCFVSMLWFSIFSKFWMKWFASSIMSLFFFWEFPFVGQNKTISNGIYRLKIDKMKTYSSIIFNIVPWKRGVINLLSSFQISPLLTTMPSSWKISLLLCMILLVSFVTISKSTGNCFVEGREFGECFGFGKDLFDAFHWADRKKRWPILMISKAYDGLERSILSKISKISKNCGYSFGLIRPVVEITAFKKGSKNLLVNIDSLFLLDLICSIRNGMNVGYWYTWVYLDFQNWYRMKATNNFEMGIEMNNKTSKIGVNTKYEIIVNTLMKKRGEWIWNGRLFFFDFACHSFLSWSATLKLC